MRHGQVQASSGELGKILDVRVAAHEHPRGQVAEGGVDRALDRASHLGLPFELQNRPAHLCQFAEHVAVDLVFTAVRPPQRPGAVIDRFELLEYGFLGLERTIDVPIEHAERQGHTVRDPARELSGELAEIRGFWAHRDAGILGPQLGQGNRGNPIEPQP